VQLDLILEPLFQEVQLDRLQLKVKQIKLLLLQDLIMLGKYALQTVRMFLQVVLLQTLGPPMLKLILLLQILLKVEIMQVAPKLLLPVQDHQVKLPTTKQEIKVLLLNKARPS
jgi:hypothetical protein